MNKNNISFPLRGVALMMAIIMFMFSCEVESSQLPNVVTHDKQTNTLRSNESDLTNEFAQAIQESINYIQTKNSLNSDDVALYVNRVAMKSGLDENISGELINSLVNNNLYITSESSLKLLFTTMHLDGKLTDSEYDLLVSLDESVQEKSDEEVIQLLVSFENSLSSNTELSEDEVLNMSNFSIVTRSTIEGLIAASGSRDWSNCVECLNRKKWIIGGSAVATVLAAIKVCSLTSVIDLTQVTFVACMAIALAVIIVEILVFCGGACFTKSPEPEVEPVCENPVCPIEFNVSVNNGFTCCTDSGIRTVPLNGKQWLVQDFNGDCPPLWDFSPVPTPACWREFVGFTSWENLHYDNENDRVCVDAGNCN